MKKLMTLLIVAIAPLFAANHTVDSSHTFVWFKVNHLGMGETMGQFRHTEGEFDLEKGKLNLKLTTKSLDTNDEKRDEHLKGPDFFNIKQFPVITFKSTSVNKKSDGTYSVKGKLQIHGKTKEIQVDVREVGGGKDPWGNQRKGISAEFTINRLDFGMNYMKDMIGTEVAIQFAAEGIAK